MGVVGRDDYTVGTRRRAIGTIDEPLGCFSRWSLKNKSFHRMAMASFFIFCLAWFYLANLIAATRLHMLSSSSHFSMFIPLHIVSYDQLQPLYQQQQQQDRYSLMDAVWNQNFSVMPRNPEPLVPEPRNLPQQRLVNEHEPQNNILTAYLETPNFDEWEILPLPIRSRARSEWLEKRQYSRVNSCQNLTQQWPVDDDDDDDQLRLPTDDDPFLPWIHDVFPTADGKFIQFVAQNRRRCNTGTRVLNHSQILVHLQPQVALFQHVPIQRLHNNRFKLSTHEHADPDGVATRFLCRFKPDMEVTFSVFNFDYDWISFRKGHDSMIVKNDGGVKVVLTSQLIFQCPVPTNLQETIRTGASVHNDWATLFLDLIPIRTPPRYGPPNQFLQPRYKEFQTTDPQIAFDPLQQWGENHTLPKIEDSGRWENIPICLPSLLQYKVQSQNNVPVPVVPKQKINNKHRLVSCIWASAGYTTRGGRFHVDDGQRRLLEWIVYNKGIGFDHFYLYDNSNALPSNNGTSLKPIADLFPDHVTYIPWPSRVCNDRPNNVDSPGERSSQYAAEASCRLRFGPHADWIGQFDVDEYLVPMGKRTNVTSLLHDLEKEDTRIISFKSWRAWPRWAYIDEIHEILDRSICGSNQPCFHLSIPQNTTVLQAYNCDRQMPGHKKKAMQAEKQLYRPDYVTHHFIHYTVVTKLSEKNRLEWEKEPNAPEWKLKAFPDPRQRFADELTEALMLHAKAVAVQDTAGYKSYCHIDNLKLPRGKQGLCRLGVPWPEPWPQDMNHLPILGTKEGYAYNCFVNDQIEYVLVPRLQSDMKAHT